MIKILIIALIALSYPKLKNNNIFNSEAYLKVLVSVSMSFWLSVKPLWNLEKKKNKIHFLGFWLKYMYKFLVNL